MSSFFKGNVLMENDHLEGNLLNQVCTWFSEIGFVHDVSMCVYVCVCVPPRL